MERKEHGVSETGSKTEYRKASERMGGSETIKGSEGMRKLRNEYEAVAMTGEQVEKMKEGIRKAKGFETGRRKVLLSIRCAAAAAAVCIILPNTSAGVAHAMSGIPVIGKLVAAVTFRDYQYESERHNADVEVPELVIREETTGETQNPEQEAVLEQTTREINAEIEEITQQILNEFKEGLQYEEGYQDIMVKHEVLSTTDNYFTLKLICYQASGSGAQWNYFYTIDLQSGERLALKDLFADGADYITPVSEEIRKQMKEQMAQDENVMYWVDNEDIPEWNFRQITDDTAFYVNQNNDLVIAFNEGDVAPMYMGCVEFIIPKEVLQEIRK